MLCAEDLAWMECLVGDTFHDTAIIQRYNSPGKDTYKIPQDGYTDQAPIAVGYRPGTPRELLGESQVHFKAPQIRVPIGTVIGHKDRVKLTRRMGTVLTTQPVFEVVGEPQLGATFWTIFLERVTDGSET